MLETSFGDRYNIQVAAVARTVAHKGRCDELGRQIPSRKLMLPSPEASQKWWMEVVQSSVAHWIPAFAGMTEL